MLKNFHINRPREIRSIFSACSSGKFCENISIYSIVRRERRKACGPCGGPGTDPRDARRLPVRAPACYPTGLAEDAVGFPNIYNFPESHPGPYECQMGGYIVALLHCDTAFSETKDRPRDGGGNEGESAKSRATKKSSPERHLLSPPRNWVGTREVARFGRRKCSRYLHGEVPWH
jgi:hypothetical protein